MRNAISRMIQARPRRAGVSLAALLLGAGLSLLASGCAEKTTGVMKRVTELAPPEEMVLPEFAPEAGISEESFRNARGTLTLDVAAGEGTVATEGLPELPEPWVYAVWFLGGSDRGEGRDGDGGHHGDGDRHGDGDHHGEGGHHEDGHHDDGHDEDGHHDDGHDEGGHHDDGDHHAGDFRPGGMRGHTMRMSPGQMGYSASQVRACLITMQGREDRDGPGPYRILQGGWEE